MMYRRFLVAFDFDHTVVEENSDIVARKLINADLIPEQVRSLYEVKGWTDYMSEIFKLLQKHNVNKDTIIRAMQNLTPAPKMSELLSWLRDEGHETIIISDSNSVFISAWLDYRNLHECVRRVFTNPASFEENGLLSIAPYHDQDWCNLSTRNLCKGHILETYINKRQEEGEQFDAVAYVGDGQNDFCPALKLKESDFVFPRSGFPLERLINSPPKDNLYEGKKVKSKVFPWVSALEIKDILKKSV